MALKVNWTERAFLHIEEILHYWEDRNGSRTYSVKLYDKVQSTLELLSFYPESGKKTDNQRLSKKIVKDYYLYYTFNEATLTVIGIIDMRRDPKYLKQFEREVIKKR